MKRLIIAAALLAVSGGVAAAQDYSRQQSIVVTGSRINAIEDGSLRSVPHINKRIRADFIQVDMTFSSGTRDDKERRDELKTMFDRVKAAAASSSEFAVDAGEAGGSIIPIETTLFSDIYSTGYGRTSSSFSLILTADTRPGETFEAVFERAEAFVEGIKTAGRAEGYLDDEQYIGARDPGKHRADLLAALKDEVQAQKALFAPASVEITGLQSRMVTQPSGPLELEVFIPYSLSVTSE